ncbi:MAG: zinc-binding alcohol dehydrogenase family protein [Idiomarina sp.]|nr:zinc-binding alcohol dehydrogenase family protein [Idiomarina sp.]
MRAVLASHGQLKDIETDKPSPGPHDLLVQVNAVSVNPVDTKVLARAKDTGDDKILGFDAVGTVVDMGAEVKGFTAGDRVWYAGDVTRPGSNAEYQCVDARIASIAPQSLNDAEAAALPLTSLTAWELLFDRMHCPAVYDDRVILVIGGAGGVGSILIQLAKKLTKATVVATASRDESKAWVKNLGADYVIDHSEPLSAGLAAAGLADVTDVVSLTHTEVHFDDVMQIIRPQGRFALIDDPATPLDISAMKQKSLSLHWEFMFTRTMFKTEDMRRQGEILAQVASLIDDGQLRTSLSKTLSPINAETLTEAHQLVLSQHMTGKVVVSR